MNILGISAFRHDSGMDGVGEWATTSAWIGQEKTLTPLREIPFAPLASAVVFGLHLLHRLHSELRRIQSHGVGAV